MTFVTTVSESDTTIKAESENSRIGLEKIIGTIGPPSLSNRIDFDDSGLRIFKWEVSTFYTVLKLILAFLSLEAPLIDKSLIINSDLPFDSVSGEIIKNFFLSSTS